MSELMCYVMVRRHSHAMPTPISRNIPTFDAPQIAAHSRNQTRFLNAFGVFFHDAHLQPVVLSVTPQDCNHVAGSVLAKELQLYIGPDLCVEAMREQTWLRNASTYASQTLQNKTELMRSA